MDFEAFVFGNNDPANAGRLSLDEGYDYESFDDVDLDGDDGRNGESSDHVSSYQLLSRNCYSAPFKPLGARFLMLAKSKVRVRYLVDAPHNGCAEMDLYANGSGWAYFSPDCDPSKGCIWGDYLFVEVVSFDYADTPNVEI